MSTEQRMPNPTAEDLASPTFEVLWQCIKTWDVGVPAYYTGHCGANGSHVKLLMNALGGHRAFVEEAKKQMNDALALGRDLAAQRDEARELYRDEAEQAQFCRSRTRLIEHLLGKVMDRLKLIAAYGEGWDISALTAEVSDELKRHTIARTETPAPSEHK
jgi:hypothetical protein